MATNDSSSLGNVGATFNLDLSTDKGRIKVSPRGVKIKQVSYPVTAFARRSTQVWAAVREESGNNGLLYKSDNNSYTWVADTYTSTPTYAISDMKLFSRNGGLYACSTVGSPTTVYYCASGATSWSSFDPSGAAIAFVPIMMCEFQNRMYISDGVKIYSWDTANTPATAGGQYTTTLSASGGDAATCMVATQEAIFIGVKSTSGNKGKVLVWNGVDNATATAATGFSQIIPTSTTGPIAMVVKDNIPYFLDENGYLQKYTGSTFEPVGKLPISPYQNAVACARNGLTVAGNRIYANVSFTSTPETLNSGSEYGFAGVWCFDEDIGFYHFASPSNSASGALSTAVDFGQMKTRGGTSGNFKQLYPGAISNYHFTDSTIQSTTQNSSLLFGSFYQTTDASFAYSSLPYIFGTELRGSSYSRGGMFITPEIDVSDVASTWSAMYLAHTPLWESASFIIPKYRTYYKPSVEYTFTYQSINSDTTQIQVNDANQSFHLDWEVGDEFMGVVGAGAGFTGHITSISPETASASYSVVIDNTVGGVTATETGIGRFSNWKKLINNDNQGKLTGATTKMWHQFSLPVTSPATKVQLKVVIGLEKSTAATLSKQEHLFSLNTIHAVESNEVKST